MQINLDQLDKDLLYLEELDKLELELDDQSTYFELKELEEMDSWD